MIVLSESTDKLQIKLAATVAANQCQCFASWLDITSVAVLNAATALFSKPIEVPGRSTVSTNNTSDVDFVGSPAGSVQREINFLSIYNADTAAVTVTLKLDANGSETIIMVKQIPAGQTLLYTHDTGFFFADQDLKATQDNGDIVAVPATSEGHLEVALHDPILPFGSLHAEGLTPVFQADAVYGINTSIITATTGLSYDPGPGAPGSNSGANTATGNLFKCATGTTAYSFATMQSRKRLRYRAGQGIVGMFTALWSSPVASSTVVAGFGSGESGFFFGYNGTSFGILHSTGNTREIQTFTVTAAATAGGAVTFTLNGLDYAQTLAASATTTLTANDIASKSYPGWSVEARGATVIFLANSVGNKAGTFSVTPGASGLTGTYAETLAGATTADTWIAQASWNGDPCDGTGASGFTLDKTKGNLFKIEIAYLGFGPIRFYVMQPSTNGNNAVWINVHTINAPNARTSVNSNQPSYPFTMAAYSAGSTTNVSVSVGSFAGFTEGTKLLNGPRMSYFNTTAVTSSTSVYTPIFSIRNDYVYSTRANQAVVNLLSTGGATKSTNGVTTFYLIRNATLTGPVNWTSWSSTSCTYADSGATGCSFSDNNQVIWSGTVSESGQFVFNFSDDITLQPGETVTLAVRSVTATATCVGQINTREDQ